MRTHGENHSLVFVMKGKEFSLALMDIDSCITTHSSRGGRLVLEEMMFAVHWSFLIMACITK